MIIDMVNRNHTLVQYITPETIITTASQSLLKTAAVRSKKLQARLQKKPDVTIESMISSQVTAMFK